MKSLAKINTADWDKFRKNQRNFQALSKIVEQLQDISDKIQGLDFNKTEDSLTMTNFVDTELDYVYPDSDETNTLSFDTPEVIQRVIEALERDCELLQIANCKIAGVKY